MLTVLRATRLNTAFAVFGSLEQAVEASGGPAWREA
jgi:hypothetical protein